MVTVGHQEYELIGELRTYSCVIKWRSIEEKGGQVSSLVPQLTIKGLNVFGERYTDAFVTFFTINTFYAMESSGLLNVEDPIQLFVLHTIFIPRINH